MTPAKPRRKSRRSYQRHGLTRAKDALSRWGERAIDGRTRQGRALAAWRDALVQDMGGEEAVSAQQLTVLELAARTKILLDGVDAWLFSQDSLVNKRSRQLYPVVKERQALADSLARYMAALGLERRKPPAMTLQAYVEAEYTDDDAEDAA